MDSINNLNLKSRIHGNYGSYGGCCNTYGCSEKFNSIWDMYAAQHRNAKPPQNFTAKQNTILGLIVSVVPQLGSWLGGSSGGGLLGKLFKK